MALVGYAAVAAHFQRPVAPVPIAVTVDGAATYVCRVTCPASPRPVYLRAPKSGGSELWVRTGNSTRLLKVDEAIDYVMHRWPLSLGSTAAAQLRAAARFSGDPARSDAG